MQEFLLKGLLVFFFILPTPTYPTPPNLFFSKDTVASMRLRHACNSTLFICGLRGIL